MKTAGAIVKGQTPGKSYWWRSKEIAACTTPSPKPGISCPDCGKGILVYNSLFILTCDHCGKTAENGTFT